MGRSIGGRHTDSLKRNQGVRVTPVFGAHSISTATRRSKGPGPVPQPLPRYPAV